MELQERAAAHAALGKEGRLRLVELLSNGDLTVRELGSALGMPGNLLAHHLNVLEEAGVIARLDSDGDRRRRYVTLRRDVLDGLIPSLGRLSGSVVFVCSHNSARSQYRGRVLAFRDRRGCGERGKSSKRPGPPDCDSSCPRARHRPEFGFPRGYESITFFPDVLVSVCDRAREEPLPQAQRRMHWSIPDPVAAGKVAGFRSAFLEVERRVDQLIA